MDGLTKVGLLAGAIGLIVVGHHALKQNEVPPGQVGLVGGVLTAVGDDPSQIGWTPSNLTSPGLDVGSLVIYWREAGQALPNAQGVFGTKWLSFDPYDYSAFLKWAKLSGVNGLPVTPPGVFGFKPTTAGSQWHP
jgi:hypothetical protein